MKHVIHGRVVGHRLFAPDPKSEIELVRIAIVLEPLGTTATEKNSRCELVIDPKMLDQFRLKQHLRLTLEDTQQVLPLAHANAARARDRKAREDDDLLH